MSTQKPTKKELQEPDYLQELFGKILDYGKKYRKTIYIVSATVFGVALIITGWFLFRMNYENKAQDMYLKTYNKYLTVQSSMRETEAIKGYQDLVKEYPSSKASLIALYRLGNLYFQAQRFDDAMKAYENFVKESPREGDLIVLALSGLGYCQEAKKDYSGALASFEKSLKTKSGILFEGILFRDMARIYELMNEKKNALEYYRKALSVTNDPSISMLLKRKISMLN